MTSETKDFFQAFAKAFSGLDTQYLEFHMAGEHSLYLKTLNCQINLQVIL